MERAMKPAAMRVAAEEGMLRMKLCWSFFGLLAAASLVQAGGEEHRSFSVWVDKKPAGSHHIVIQSRDDGAQVVTAQADVAVRILLVNFRYTYRGSETYKDGRLLQMSTTTNDDGKKHSVTIEATKEGLAMKADGKDFLVKGEPWVTTYWKLPPEKQRGPNIQLLDADTGKLINAKFEKVGIEKITLLGRPTECTHYKLSGGVQVDLWYDGDERMVRQESIEQGHRTLLELSRLQKD
jgi:hypothetical protein